jgi:DUF1009 family protein
VLQGKKMKIGLIAGGGQFPILFSRKARQSGYQVYALGFKSETDPALRDFVDDLTWIYLGQLSRLIKYFKSNGIDQVVLLGSINKTNIFKNLRPDLKILSLAAKTALTHDDSILTIFADLLADEGIEVKPSTFLIPELLSPEGCWTKRQPDKAEKKDIAAGWKIAKEIGRLDIGQCLVISNGTVLAVEAIEGTDETIRRGGRLSENSGAVLVKLSKPTQDLRFDLPSLGIQTIKTMVESGVTTLAIEAKKTLSFDRDEMIKLANHHKISIVAYTDDDMQ